MQYINYVKKGLKDKVLYALQNADYVTTTTEYPLDKNYSNKTRM